MSTRQEIEKRLEEQLESLSSKIDKLNAKIKKEQERENQIEQQSLLNITSMCGIAQEKLQSFKEAGDDKWEELSISLEKYWESLGFELKAFEDRI